MKKHNLHKPILVDCDSVCLNWEYAFHIWREDKYTNAEVGHRLGLRMVLMKHGHNLSYHHPDIPRVKNWREIYELITS